jgi:hypothetical protein
VRYTVYKPHERPEVEVLVAGTWHYGELRIWTHNRDGSWSAQVTGSRAVGENLIDTFRADDV